MKQYYPCILCGKSQSNADIVDGKINDLSEKINLIHSYPTDICICNRCISVIKEVIKKQTNKGVVEIALIKVEAKAILSAKATNSVEKEIRTLITDIRIDVRSAARLRLYGLINECINGAYQLGKANK